VGLLGLWPGVDNERWQSLYGYNKRMSDLKHILPKGKKLKGSHKRQCSICLHKKRAEIELDFLTGRPIGKICKDYGVTKSPLYNHMGLKGFTEYRSAHPSIRVEYLAEELADDVVYRGSDIVAMNRDLMKQKGELGADTNVNVNQNIANFTEVVKGMSEEELRAWRDEVRRKMGHGQARST
jgi:hypothetical protein